MTELRIISHSEAKRIAYEAEARDPMRVGSYLLHCKDYDDIANSLAQLRRNESELFK
jgi:hypothetical protein